MYLHVYLLIFTSQHFCLSSADHQRKFGEDYGSCQAGISNFLTKVSNTYIVLISSMCSSGCIKVVTKMFFFFYQDLIIMGAPGTSYWTGSVLVYNTSSRGMSVYVDDDTRPVSFGSYLGNMILSQFFSQQL